MKPITAEYSIIGMDQIYQDPKPEERIELYGDENMYNYLEELAQILSDLSPGRLFLLGKLYSQSPTEILTGYFGGDEINIAEDGTYFKIEGDSLYKLVDENTGLRWEFNGHDIFEKL